MNLCEAVKKLISAVRPWPPRADRKAAVSAAQARAEAARRNADHDRRIAEEITRMAQQDPLAAAIARQIQRGRPR